MFRWWLFSVLRRHQHFELVGRCGHAQRHGVPVAVFPQSFVTSCLDKSKSFSSPYAPPSVESLEKDIKSLRVSLKALKQEHGFPERATSNPASLYIKFRTKKTAVMPGLGSSARPKIKDLYREWHEEWAKMTEVSKMRFVKEAERNKQAYEDSVKRWEQSHSGSEVADMIENYKNEISFLTKRLTLLKSDLINSKIEESR